jgi:hypothetical protein
VTPVSKEFIKVFKTPYGYEIDLITGSFTQSYANLRTGKTITENGSASARRTTNADGSSTVAVRGCTPTFLTPADTQRFELLTVAVVAGAPWGVRPSISWRSRLGHADPSVALQAYADVCCSL